MAAFGEYDDFVGLQELGHLLRVDVWSRMDTGVADLLLAIVG